jgi:PAS domain-containing protein
MDDTEKTGKNVEKKKNPLHKQDAKLEKAESRLHNMEMLLLESEDKYQALIEKSIHGILVIQGLIIKYANKAMLNTFGCRDEGEIIEHDFMEFVSSKHREPVVKEIRLRKKNKETLLQYE